jgi:hypothetical protein
LMSCSSIGRVARLLEQYPDLNLPQVHAALTYYYDNPDEIDAGQPTLRKTKPGTGGTSAIGPSF